MPPTKEGQWGIAYYTCKLLKSYSSPNIVESFSEIDGYDEYLRAIDVISSRMPLPVYGKPSISPIKLYKLAVDLVDREIHRLAKDTYSGDIIEFIDTYLDLLSERIWRPGKLSGGADKGDHIKSRSEHNMKIINDIKGAETSYLDEPCSKCGKLAVRLKTEQRRSADEGATIIKRCEECGFVESINA